MTDASTRIACLAGVCAFSMLSAAVPSRAGDAETITACVGRDGRVRIPAAASRKDRKASCGPGEGVVTWNIAGPPGPAGEEGPAGPPGPPGLGLAGTQFFTVGVGDLRPAAPGIFGTSFGPPPGGSFSAAAAPLLAGVHLPHGAHVLAVRAHVFDNSTSDLRIELIEQPMSGDIPTLLSTTSSTGAAGAVYTVADVLPAAHQVDAERFHYFVRVLPDPVWTATTLQVIGVTLVYTLAPAPAPPGY